MPGYTRQGRRGRSLQRLMALKYCPTLRTTLMPPRQTTSPLNGRPEVEAKIAAKFQQLQKPFFIVSSNFITKN
ncbi:hypothetical protein LAZ67_16001278 [Cordylochernes scorpioides]|uniref:Uncharacterized protein n=1 Tax=Cordylochernes scorpioides TaxID=51811 RepID=A0ABY6LC48_9ARAC|nr:hypothetical protein LAZ67_16001278 [Cordylochernes scorpioides]